jgi:peptidoglycan-associated lipoprotein
MTDYVLRMTCDERGAVSIISREPVDRRRETGADVLVVVVALLAPVAPLSARPVSPTLLYETPTANVLPAGALSILADMTYPLIRTPYNVNYPEVDANVRFSPYRKLDFALTAYTFADYALDVKYQAVGSGPDRFGLAVGVYDVGFNGYVSPIGHDTANAWPDWKYNKYLPRYNRQTERFSAFVVTSIPVTKFARLHLGLGRGRFVGYDINSRYFNIDYFFDEYHQWAFGLFGGVEVFVTPQVALVAEVSGRDVNTGVKVNFRAFTGTAAWTKMEGLLASKGDARFGRLEVGLTYQFNNLFRHPARLVVPAPAPPAPPPESVPVTAPQPKPETVAVAPVKFDLRPIYFDLDRSDIRPGDAEILKRNAEAILARVKAGLRADVIIEGCFPLASGTYQAGLAMRRAQAAKAYLVGLGVDAALLTTRTFGETNPPSQTTGVYYLDRRVEFRWKY